MKIIQLIYLLLFFITGNLYAQSPCERSYQKAIVAFENGRFDEIEALLDTCINVELFSATWQVFKGRKAVYQQLVTEAHLETQNWMKASQGYNKLLTINPNFKIDPSTVTNEFLQLAKQYQVYPKWTFILQTSVVVTNRKFDDRFTVDGVTILEEELTTSENILKLNENSSYCVGIQYQLTPRLGIGLETGYFASRLDYIGKYDDAVFTDGERYTLGLAFDEREQWLYFPAYLKVRFPFKSSNIVKFDFRDRLLSNLEVYAYAGASANVLLSSEFEALILLNEEIDQFLTTETVNLQQNNNPEPNLRRTFNYVFLGGIGLQYRLKNAALFFDIRYSQNQLNQVRENVRYSNNRLVENYNYVDSDFRDARLSYTIGGAYSFFKSRKTK